MYRFHEGSAPQEKKPEEVAQEVDTSWVDLAEGNLYQENAAEAIETIDTPTVGLDMAEAASEQIAIEPAAANENFNSDWVDLAEGNVVQEPENILDRKFDSEVTKSSELIKSITDGSYGNKALEIPSPEKIKETLSTMGAGAQEFFGTMSEKGRAAASALYEGINKIPGMQRLTSKMGIAYSQFFIDRQEKSISENKEQLSGIENEIAKIQEDSAQLEMIITNLPKNGTSGLSGMERKANKLDEQKIALLGEQVKLTERISRSGEKMEALTGKRDAIADKMIGIYAEKLALAEGKISKIEADKKLAEDDIEAANTIHELDLKQLDFQESQLKKAEAIYQSRGLPLGDIRAMEKQIANSREKIRKSQESLQDRLSKITDKIKKAEDRATPFKDRQKEFTDLKRGSESIDTPVPEGDSEIDTEPNIDEAAVVEENVGAPVPEQQIDNGAIENTVELPEIVQYIKSEGLAEAASSQEEIENIQSLVAIIREDPEIGSFLENFYTATYDDEKLLDLVGKFTERFAADNKVIYEDEVSISEKPLILTHPSGNQKIALRLNDNHLQVTIIKN